jgi:hypothetical protein
MKQNGFAPLLLILILAILGIIGYFVFVFYTQRLPAVTLLPSPTPAIDASGSATPDPSLIIGWKTYVNPDFGLELKYPKEFSYKSIGSNRDEITSTTSAVIARSRPEITDRIAFTDSNKNQFTLNFYALSPDPAKNTGVGNLSE